MIGKTKDPPRCRLPGRVLSIIDIHLLDDFIKRNGLIMLVHVYNLGL
jgi:hypothetical protein